MYCQYFGLAKPPFKITPDPALFFPGGQRGEVLAALVYAIVRGEGIIKVVGEVGSGKTMLCRMLERALPDECEIIYLANPRLAPEDILHAMVLELELPVARAASRSEVMQSLHDYLLARHAANRRVVMFVEEAQSMPTATLEEIRLLSNLETTQDKLLQIVLFGQPELDRKLAGHAIRQLNERITFHFQLAPLTVREIRDYLNARLHASGYRGPELFSPAAVRAVARSSRGWSRRVNILADKALLAAFTVSARRVSAQHVVLAARDSRFAAPRAGRAAWLVMGTLLLVGGAGWLAGAVLKPPPAPLATGQPGPSNREFAALSWALSSPAAEPAGATEQAGRRRAWWRDDLPPPTNRPPPAMATPARPR